MVRMWCFAACFRGAKITPTFSDLFLGPPRQGSDCVLGECSPCANAPQLKLRCGAFDRGLGGDRSAVAYFVACVFDGAI